MLQKGRLMKRIAMTTAAVLVGLGAGSAIAGDASNGEVLAQHWCTSCHVVAPQATTRTVEGVPTFMEVARNPKNTRARLVGFLTEPHAPMPNFHLSRNEMDDLITYIETLR